MDLSYGHLLKMKREIKKVGKQVIYKYKYMYNQMITITDDC